MDSRSEAGPGSLDFWLGRWTVLSPDGDALGENEIVALLGGAAVVERWRGADGGEGMSLFYYDRRGAMWKQVWVTDTWTHKEKQLVDRRADGGLVFQGAIRARDGTEYLDRTTLTPLSDGRVRQVIETSVDGGGTWRLGFDGRYARQSEPSAVAPGSADVREA